MPISEVVNVFNKFAKDIGVQAKEADTNKETPTNGLAPTSSKEKDAKAWFLVKLQLKQFKIQKLLKI